MNTTPYDKADLRHGLGWRRQRLDMRDDLYQYAPVFTSETVLPERAYVARNLPIWDQGNLGSCTAQAVNRCILFDAVNQGLLTADVIPSRLMTYWGERWYEGSVYSDAGAEIRDGIKFIARYGTCLEKGPDSWPYDISRFTERPPDACWANALKFQALRYMSVPQSLPVMRACIAEGFPFIIGFVCYSGLLSQHTEETGLVGLPGPHDTPIGGHAVTIVGYNNEWRYFKFANSWGSSWGDKGYGYLPFEYVLRPDLSADMWTIRLVG